MTFEIIFIIVLVLHMSYMIKKIFDLRTESEQLSTVLDRYTSFRNFTETMDRLNLRMYRDHFEELRLLEKMSELLGEAEDTQEVD